MNKIIFPGSFDPITLGHVDLIKRANEVFEEVIILVAANTNKNNFFSIDKRIKVIEKVIQREKLNNVKVEKTNKMLVDFCEQKQIFLILRGLRNETDLAYETNMANHNQIINPKIEVICLITKPDKMHISSSAVREISSYNHSITHLVPVEVVELLEEQS